MSDLSIVLMEIARLALAKHWDEVGDELDLSDEELRRVADYVCDMYEENVA